jgi:hypothetical protein
MLADGIVIFASFLNNLVTIGVSSYSTGTGLMDAEFNVSAETGTVGLTTFIVCHFVPSVKPDVEAHASLQLGFALGPMLLAPLSYVKFPCIPANSPLTHTTTESSTVVVQCTWCRSQSSQSFSYLSRLLPTSRQSSCVASSRDSLDRTSCRTFIDQTPDALIGPLLQTLAVSSTTSSRETKGGLLSPSTPCPQPTDHRLGTPLVASSHRQRGGGGFPGST